MKEEIAISGKTNERGKMPAGTIILYVLAALSLICAGFMLYYSITYVQSYYESYGMSMSEGITEVIQYVISGSGTYLGFAVVFWAAGLILAKLERLSNRKTRCEAEPEERLTMEELDTAQESRSLERSQNPGADDTDDRPEEEREEKED